MLVAGQLTGRFRDDQTQFGPWSVELAPGRVHAFTAATAPRRLADLCFGHPAVEVSEGALHLFGEDLLARETAARVVIGLRLLAPDQRGIPGITAGQYLRALHRSLGGSSDDEAEFRARVEGELQHVGLERADLKAVPELSDELFLPLALQLLALVVGEPRLVVAARAEAWWRDARSRELLGRALARAAARGAVVVVADPLVMTLPLPWQDLPEPDRPSEAFHDHA